MLWSFRRDGGYGGTWRKRGLHGGRMAERGLCEPFVWARPAQDGSGPRARAAGGGVAVVATPPGVSPGAGRRSIRSRTVSAYARADTRKPLQTKHLR